MSNSPLLNLPGPSQDLLNDIESVLTQARDFVADFNPDEGIVFTVEENAETAAAPAEIQA